MSEALSRHAEEADAELEARGERHVQLCRDTCSALTDSVVGRGVRRPCRIRQLATIAGASGAEIIAVVDVFRGQGRAFLMPPEGVELDESTVIDIPHESQTCVRELETTAREQDLLLTNTRNQLEHCSEAERSANATIDRVESRILDFDPRKTCRA